MNSHPTEAITRGILGVRTPKIKFEQNFPKESRTKANASIFRFHLTEIEYLQPPDVLPGIYTHQKCICSQGSATDPGGNSQLDLKESLGGEGKGMEKGRKEGKAENKGRRRKRLKKLPRKQIPGYSVATYCTTH